MSLDQPRFRRDLEAVPLEADGQRYVDVRDPSTGVSFRLYDFEYHVALAFDGLTFDKIIPWLKLAAGISAEPRQLRDFAAQLDALGFLEREDGEPAAAPGAGVAGPMPVAEPAPEPLGELGSPAGAGSEPEHPFEEAAPRPAESRDEVLDPTTAEAPAEMPAAAAEALPPPGPAEVTADVVPGQAVSSIQEAIAQAGSGPEAAVAEVIAPAEVAPAEEAAAAPEEIHVAPEEPVVAADEAVASPVEAGGAAEAASGEAAPEGMATAFEAAYDQATAAETVVERAGMAAALEPALEKAAAEEPAAPFEEAAPSEEAPPSEEASPPAGDGVESEPTQGAPEQTAMAPEETYGVPQAILTPPIALAEMAGAPDEAGEEPDETARSAEDPAAKPSPAETFAAAAWVSAAWTQAPATQGPGSEGEVARHVEEAESAAAETAPGPDAAPEAGGPALDAAPEMGAPSPAAPPDEVPAQVPARHLDSTAFPVLPTPPPVSVETRPPAQVTPVVLMPLAVTPPPWVLSPPYVTPSPATLGPLPVAVRRRQRRSLLLFGSLGVLTAAAVLAIVLPFFFPPHGPPRTSVRTLTAVPGPIVRYFASTGTVAPLPGPVLKFPFAGKVLKVAKPGTVVVAGDVLAAVEAARALLGQLAQQRERLAFYQQMAEGMRQAGNTVEEERQMAKVEERKARIAKTMRALAQVAVVASSAGTVEESFARDGDAVEAGSLALRLSSAGHRATFDLPGAQAAEARRLGFCQVGVDGHLLDCTPSPDRDGRVSVELAVLPAALVGRPARLARARWGGAVALPTSALQRAGRRPQVLVVSASGRVEVRPVTVAEQSASEAIVIQGLDAGDNVIIAPSANLRPGAAVTPHS